MASDVAAVRSWCGVVSSSAESFLGLDAGDVVDMVEGKPLYDSEQKMWLAMGDYGCRWNCECPHEALDRLHSHCDE